MRWVAMLLAAVPTLWVHAQPVQEIEITPDPPGAQKQIYTCRFMPGETAEYQQLAFECRLRQVVELPNIAGQPVQKVHELPTPHIHREKNVRMVKDLDNYVSFWVPVGVEELRSRFGVAVQTNGPAQLARLRVAAYQNGRVVWAYDLPTNGVLQVKAVASKP